MNLSPFTYHRPVTVKEAVKLLAGADNGRAHGGGTDLLGCMRDHCFAVDEVVSLSSLDDLRGMEKTAEGGLRIGALTTLSEIAVHPGVNRAYPVLAQAALAAASPQLRNQGTIGGNLCQEPRCWYFRGDFHCLRKGGGTCFAFEGENQYHRILGKGPCVIVHPSDPAPALAALGAGVTTARPGGGRTLAVDKLFVPPEEDPTRMVRLEPGEIITHVTIPPPSKGLRSAYRKVRVRAAWDFAIAGMATALDVSGGRVNGGRVVFSGVAPVPWRSREVEEIIIGSRLTPEVIDKAAQAAVSKTAPLSGNGYKVPLLEAVVRQELTAIAEA
ncbi:FAD binding domain-containing protein [Desulfohalovibrio reitneri]|uniref:FAD binding domain-containing protein n=1 Tax=Desulfohalovibrio reitneri TaxID=1307759 RepID=UPI0004A6E0FA|nr:FAD binding domain-containing protein [Desulfohalovibrio reitneri]